jgi:hypothetical protein
MAQRPDLMGLRHPHIPFDDANKHYLPLTAAAAPTPAAAPPLNAVAAAHDPMHLAALSHTAVAAAPTPQVAKTGPLIEQQGQVARTAHLSQLERVCLLQA